MRVLIVGGGIGGLTLAAARRRSGAEVTLLEQAAAWAPVGAGISLAANAVRILGALGALDALLARGHVIRQAIISDAKGRTLSTAHMSAIALEFGPMIAIHRGALHEVLLSLQDGVDIHLGTTVRDIDDRGAVVNVEFSDGRAASFDAVIGADGIHSLVREMTFGRTVERYSGYTCWRLVVRHEIPPGVVYEMWGRGKRFGIAPIGGGLVYCYSTLNAPPQDARCAAISLDDYRATFAEFGGLVPGILATLRDRAELIHNDLNDIQVPTWVRGRVGLLGDAAHAMTPNLGQGAGMSIEDAWVLAEELARADVPAARRDVPAALDAYEARRRKRVEMIRSRSWSIGRVAQWESPVACALRNALVKATPDATTLSAVRKLLTAQI